MNLYNVIGAPGMGKSEFVKSLIRGRNCLVFDVQNEYGSRTKYPGQVPVNLATNNNDLRSRVVDLNMKKFLELCKRKRNTVCCFEESTGFFHGSIGLETTNLIISKIHSGNSYVFVWHSINRCPPSIMELSNFVVLYKTNDTRGKIKQKYEGLLSAFDYLQGKPNGEKLIIDLYKM